MYVLYIPLILIQIVERSLGESLSTGFHLTTGYRYNASVDSIKQQYSVTEQWKCTGVCAKSANCVAINVRCSGGGKRCECDLLADVATGKEQLIEEENSAYMGPGIYLESYNKISYNVTV